MPTPLADKLPRREREVLDVLFSFHGRASVEDIRDRMEDRLSYSTVRTILTRLEAKGYVRHREENLRYVYEPAVPRSFAARAALRKVVQIFFAGSPQQTVTALLKNEKWTNEQLESLEAEIRQARKDGRNS